MTSLPLLSAPGGGGLQATNAPLAGEERKLGYPWLYFSALVDSPMSNMSLRSPNSAHPIHRRHQLGLYGILSCQKGSSMRTAGTQRCFQFLSLSTLLQTRPRTKKREHPAPANRPLPREAQLLTQGCRSIPAAPWDW